MTAETWKCAAQGSTYPDFQDCDWPFCGCDENALKVVESLHECGWLSDSEARTLQSQCARMKEALQNAMGYLDTPVARRKLCIDADEPWLLEARGALEASDKSDTHRTAG